MEKITAEMILKDFQRMLREKWKYVSGGAETGQVDCSGAFVWAYRQHGLSIYHGANRIAREHVVELIPFAEAKERGIIIPGMAALKTRKPGEARYALPAAYRKGGSHYNGDLLDYYHIGMVDADTEAVLNAQGTATGFVRSPITQNWSHVARLKALAYEEAPDVEVRISRAAAAELLAALMGVAG